MQFRDIISKVDLYISSSVCSDVDDGTMAGMAAAAIPYESEAEPQSSSRAAAIIIIITPRGLDAAGSKSGSLATKSATVTQFNPKTSTSILLAHSSSHLIYDYDSICMYVL